MSPPDPLLEPLPLELEVALLLEPLLDELLLPLLEPPLDDAAAPLELLLEPLLLPPVFDTTMQHVAPCSLHE